MSSTTARPDAPATGKRHVDCPTCGAPVAWVVENSYRPFCSARCKLIDFGAWAAEEYRVEAQTPELTPDDGEQELPAATGRNRTSRS